MPHRTARAARRRRCMLAVAAVFTLSAPLVACTHDGDASARSEDSDPAATEAQPGLDPGPAVEIEPILDGLSIPWDVVRDPDGVVVTGERDSGEVFAITPQGGSTLVEADFGELHTRGESGLMGIALASDFETSREVYTCHSSADHGDNRVTAWTAADDWSALEAPEVIVEGIPLQEYGYHSGCRILAHPDGTLYIGTGDSFDGPTPQDPDSLGGKILHVDRSGAPAADTIDASGVLTYGHRNVQGLALRPGTGTDPGQILAAEHGPDFDDEVNLVIPGSNYGWDPNRDGEHDESASMTDLEKFPDAVEAAWSSGEPTLAPSGIAFLDDPAWGDWDGALAVAMLKSRQIVLMKLDPDGTRVVEMSTVIPRQEGRIRSVTAEPGGSLLATTSNGGGDDKVIRIRPAAG